MQITSSGRQAEDGESSDESAGDFTGRWRRVAIRRCPGESIPRWLRLLGHQALGKRLLAYFSSTTV